MVHLLTFAAFAAVVTAASTSSTSASSNQNQHQNQNQTWTVECDQATLACGIDVVATSADDCSSLRATLLDASSGGFCAGLGGGEGAAACAIGLKRTLSNCDRAFAEEGSKAYAVAYFFRASPPQRAAWMQQKFAPTCNATTHTCSIETPVYSAKDCAVLRAQDFCNGLPTDIPSKAFSLHSICVTLYNAQVDECFDWFYHGLAPTTFKFSFIAKPELYASTVPVQVVANATTASSTADASQNNGTSPKNATQTDSSTSSSCTFGQRKCSPDSTSLLQCSYVYNDAGKSTLAWIVEAPCPSGQICLINLPSFAGCVSPSSNVVGGSFSSGAASGNSVVVPAAPAPSAIAAPSAAVVVDASAQKQTATDSAPVNRVVDSSHWW
ncbi:hypothetical protein BCR33DRAFT_712324 [Rhizoclosmatium globosum]|uniref:Ig-like domain-containing protein n=1 Tax=Rhizoclosmatium globosum TaxID=329046 RepID=A0A1Y2CYJ9_9FUNG|nr:hypothetical protein BCR33DRAFT_712324 [Rhizoclosmatium globosum]|eukprot:ORY52113.1 hypothetical protein BCR33DRAFT_712324 [Rhizoclosmatium globosum]